MLLQALGASLTPALAIALSPFPVIGVVVVVTGAHGRRTGPAFALGWLLGLGAATALAVLLLSGAADAASTTATVVDVARVVGGAVLVGLGVRTWLRRDGDGPKEPPAWMASLATASPGGAVRAGLLLGGANPKNLVLASAAVAAVVETGVPGTALGLAVAVFVLLASSTVLAAVAVGLVGGASGAAGLDRTRALMVTHSTALTAAVLVLIGANVLGGGLDGFGR